MIEKLPIEIIENIFDALPADITFLDDADTVRYYSKGDKRIFKRSPSVIGKRVQDCHPQKSLPKVEQVISELKSAKRDVAEILDRPSWSQNIHQILSGKG